MIRSVQYAGHRVVQTVRRFDNGGQILTGIARRIPELTFQIDQSLSMVCPNVSGARLPIYEVFADDTYRVGWLLEGLPSDAGVLDIGGHIGSFAVRVATMGDGVRVAVYEASPFTAGYAQRNVDANDLGARVTVHAAAVSSHGGTISFADDGNASVHNGITAPAGTNVITVPSVTFSDAVAAAGGPVHVVKIDAEGAEFDLVLASSPSDWADVQRVVMEYHPAPGHTWQELVDFFAQAGLQVADRQPITDALGMMWLARDAA